MPRHTPAKRAKRRAKRRRKGNLGLTDKQATTVTTLLSPKSGTMADAMNKRSQERQSSGFISPGFIKKARELKRKKKR